MKDVWGVICSGLCIVHCLFIPVLLVFGITSASVALFESEWVHLILAVPMIVLAVWSIFQGWRAHQKSKPVILAASGLVFLLGSLTAAEHYEVYLAVAAGLLLIFAHLFNLKLMKQYALQWT